MNLPYLHAKVRYSYYTIYSYSAVLCKLIVHKKEYKWAVALNSCRLSRTEASSDINPPMVDYFLYRISRLCVKSTSIGGVHIPEGAQVHIPIKELHNDPKYWRNPEKFDPNRYPAICRVIMTLRNHTYYAPQQVFTRGRT